MRTLVLLAILASTAVTGCSDGGGSSPPDAFVPPDVAPDAPASLSGLGQKCDPAMMNADCPANAPLCTGFTGTTTYCSPLCVTNGTAKGAANNQFDPASIMPPPSDTICTGAYTAATGMPVCGGILPNFMPMDNPLVVNKNYTNINMTCVVLCSNNACPAGLVTNNSVGACICVPQ